MATKTNSILAEECGYCQGHKLIWTADGKEEVPCATCNGTGRVDLSEDEWKVKIAVHLDSLRVKCPSTGALGGCGHHKVSICDGRGWVANPDFHVWETLIPAMEAKGFLMLHLRSVPFDEEKDEWSTVWRVEKPIKGTDGHEIAVLSQHTNAYAAALLALESEKENRDDNN